MNILPDINIPRGYDEEIFLLYSIMLAISLYVLSKKCEIGKKFKNQMQIFGLFIFLIWMNYSIICTISYVKNTPVQQRDFSKILDGQVELV